MLNVADLLPALRLVFLLPRFNLAIVHDLQDKGDDLLFSTNEIKYVPGKGLIATYRQE